jgi:translation initiation factor 2B subunit (eIF-2B alpha/beta/delta family)
MRPPVSLDSISPQTALVEQAVAWLAGRIAADEPSPPDARIVADAVALADAQPAMGALVAVGTRLIAVARKAAVEEATAAETRERLALALATWHTDFQAASEAIVRESATLLPGSPWIATTTRSSLVERALLAAHTKGHPVKVLLSESRPMNEGIGLAKTLAEAGVPSWFAVDAALPLLLPQAGAVWIGVDAVREKSFVTKAGTYALLLVARELNVPAYAFAQRAKFLPDRCVRLTLPRRAASEVWEDAPPLVSVVNLPFEEVPLALVRGVLTEGGFLSAREIEDAAGSAPVAEELLQPPQPSPA